MWLLRSAGARGWIDAARRGRAVAVLAGALALAASTTALVTPGASAAATTHNCGSKSFDIEIQGAPGSAPTKFKLKVEQIRAQGVSCQAAYKFLEALYGHAQLGIPGKYKCATGKFKVAPGKVPEVCIRPGAKIQYAGQGG